LSACRIVEKRAGHNADEGLKTWLKSLKTQEFEQPRSPQWAFGCEIGLNGQDSPPLGRARRDLPSDKFEAARSIGIDNVAPHATTEFA
jgi:hypothetical protein